MRIVLACEHWYPDTYGGSERYARETAVRLAAAGHNVTIWTLRNSDPALAGTEHDSGMVVHRHGRVGSVVPRTLTMLQVGRRARRTARQADLVITHHTWPSVALGLPRPNAPILHQFHASTALEWDQAGADASERLRAPALRAVRPAIFRGYHRAAAAAGRRTVGQASAVAVLSHFSRSIVAQICPEALGRLAIVPGGVDVARFSPAADRAALRRRLGFADGEVVLLTVRRIVPRTGLVELARAIGRLAPRHPELRLVIVGDGPLRPRLEAELQRQGIADRALLTGRVDDDRLLGYYRAADLFVLPTQAYEGFGMATLEALACGTPVVGTPAGATPEILAPLELELVSRSVSDEAIAEALERVLNLPLEELRGRARRHVLEHYDWDLVMGRYQALCETVAGGTATSTLA